MGLRIRPPNARNARSRCTMANGDNGTICPNVHPDDSPQHIIPSFLHTETFFTKYIKSVRIEVFFLLESKSWKFKGKSQE